MDFISLVFIGVAVFCIGMLLSWKFGRRMTPEEKALYDVTFTQARKSSIEDKAIVDAQRSVQTGGLGGALESFSKGFSELQEEGAKMNLPSLLDYDEVKKHDRD